VQEQQKQEALYKEQQLYHERRPEQLLQQRLQMEHQHQHQLLHQLHQMQNELVLGLGLKDLM
jgi:hypothetical protein